MKTIQIPGGRQDKGEDICDCVDFGDDLHLKYTADGDLKWDDGRNAFTPPLTQGPVQANTADDFIAPNSPLIVHGTFDPRPSGKQTKIKIEVKKDPKCRDK